MSGLISRPTFMRRSGSAPKSTRVEATISYWMEVRELCFGRIFSKRISRLSEAHRGTTAQVRFVNGRAQENWASTENAASAKKRSLEKYIVMCHGNGLLLITTNEALPNHARLRVPLLRREIESLRPPPPLFWRKFPVWW